MFHWISSSHELWYLGQITKPWAYSQLFVFGDFIYNLMCIFSSLLCWSIPVIDTHWTFKLLLIIYSIFINACFSGCSLRENMDQSRGYQIALHPSFGVFTLLLLSFCWICLMQGPIKCCIIPEMSIVGPYPPWQWHGFPLSRRRPVFFSYSDKVARGAAICRNRWLLSDYRARVTQMWDNPCSYALGSNILSDCFGW